MDITFIPKTRQLYICFKDNGIGIPHQELKRIFRKFYQLGQSDNMTAKGSGLGLYLADIIVRMHKGRIKAESDGIGHGAVFTVMLPIKEGRNNLERGRMNATEKKRILIIEDEHHIAEGLALNLSPERPCCAHRRKRGRRTAEVERVAAGPDCVGYHAARHRRVCLYFAIFAWKMSICRCLFFRPRAMRRIKSKGFRTASTITCPNRSIWKSSCCGVERLLFRAPRTNGGQGSKNDNQGSTQAYSFGGNWINFSTATAYGQRGNIDLTELEVKLLKLFVTSRGKPVSRGQLLEIGWGYDRRTQTRTVDNFIVRFRKYFEPDPKHPIYFRSIRSVGYLFDHEEGIRQKQ